LSDRLREELPNLPSGRAVLFDAFLRAAEVEADLSVSEFADRHRVISPDSGSPFPGPWRTSRVPYVREPTDCLHPDHPARRIPLKFSAQTGKSEIGVNWFCFIVDRAPGPTMIVLPTGGEASKYNRVKLQPTIDASPRIAARVKPAKSRDKSSSTKAFKAFAGGFAQIVSASSSKGLQMVSIRWLIFDELSGYLRDVDGRGSPAAQARARQKTFGDLGKELAISTPGTAGECEISELYEASDRRRYYVPCPGCGAFHVLKYEAMLPPSEMTAWRVTFGCPSCGQIIDQSQREGMLAAGRWIPTWVAEGEKPVPAILSHSEVDSYAIAPCTGRVAVRQPGYALWSAYSPMESWTDIWRRGEDARGDPVKYKVFAQQDLGEAYEQKTDKPDWEKLYAKRGSWARGVVPGRACVLTGFIDVQGNRFEWGLWAWGEGFQGWLVDRNVISGGCEDPNAWAAIDALVARRWPTETGRQIDVLQWGMDTGAYTQALYDKLSKRAAILATKGDNRPNAAPFKKTRADLRGPDGRAIAGRRIDLGWVGAYDLKSSVYEGLRSLVAGPDASGAYMPSTLHLPDWVGEDELKQITAETLADPRDIAPGVRKKGRLVRPSAHKEWFRPSGVANEALDIVVGARALAWGEGAGQLDAFGWREWAQRAHGAPLEPPPLDDEISPAANEGAKISPTAPETPGGPADDEDSLEAQLERLGKLNAERWQ
jgi:phage terminase large subunit GpA-like protein